jgi:hypothetical protein
MKRLRLAVYVERGRGAEQKFIHNFCKTSSVHETEHWGDLDIENRLKCIETYITE